MAAHAQGKFWQYHDKIFQNQENLGPADLARYAKELKLDMKKFDKAMIDGTYKAYVDADSAKGTAAGVDGTPAMLINGSLLVGAVPYDQIKLEVDGAIELARELMKEKGLKRKGYYQSLMKLIP